MLAYMRLIANPDDDPAFIRALTTPKRGVGTATLERLGAWAGERGKSLFASAHEEGFRLQVQKPSSNRWSSSATSSPICNTAPPARTAARWRWR